MWEYDAIFTSPLTSRRVFQYVYNVEFCLSRWYQTSLHMHQTFKLTSNFLVLVFYISISIIFLILFQRSVESEIKIFTILRITLVAWAYKLHRVKTSLEQVPHVHVTFLDRIGRAGNTSLMGKRVNFLEIFPFEPY